MAQESFGAWLAGLGSEELTGLLAARPDATAEPQPATLGELPQRLSLPHGVYGALAGASLPQLQLLEALAALGDGSSAAVMHRLGRRILPPEEREEGEASGSTPRSGFLQNKTPDPRAKFTQTTQALSSPRAFDVVGVSQDLAGGLPSRLSGLVAAFPLRSGVSEAGWTPG